MDYHRIAVSTSDPLACQIASILQFLNNALDGSLGDSHLLGSLAEQNFWLGVDQGQDVCVIGKKRPALLGDGCCFR